MKKILPFVLCLSSVILTLTTWAQGNKCSIEKIGFQITSVAPNGPNGCSATADIFFVAKVRNPAQKFFTAHVWERSTYPNFPYGPGKGVPTATELQNSKVLRTIVVEDKGSGNNMDWQLSQVYDGDENSSLVNNSGVTLTAFTVPESAPKGIYNQFKDYVFFRLTGVSVTTATSACQSLNLAVDVWGTNAAKNSAVQCVNKNIPLFECTPEGLPQITGTIICENPRAFSLTFKNAGGCFPYFINYDVIADANNDGALDAGDKSVIGDKDKDGFPDGAMVVFPGQDSTTPLQTYTGFPQNNLFIKATAYTFLQDGSGINVIELDDEIDPNPLVNECAPLPVKFASFTAVRNGQNKHQIDLSWTTAQEQNNRGFHVQRKTAGEWQNIGFVFSAADGGNSSAPLTYSFKDVNNFRGTSHYRLLQVDLDEQATFSEVRSVRGLEQAASVLVYPNPATGGKVNVLFAEEGIARDVVVSDMSGRIVKQFREITNSVLAIDGLASGFYTIKITDRKTAAVQVEKVVVQ